MKKTQAHVSIWGLLMALHKHRNAFLDVLNGKEVPIETVRLNLFNHVLALFRAKFAYNLAIRNLVFRWELCKGCV